MFQSLLEWMNPERRIAREAPEKDKNATCTRIADVRAAFTEFGRTSGLWFRLGRVSRSCPPLHISDYYVEYPADRRLSVRADVVTTTPPYGLPNFIASVSARPVHQNTMYLATAHSDASIRVYEEWTDCLSYMEDTSFDDVKTYAMYRSAMGDVVHTHTSLLKELGAIVACYCL